MQRKKRKKRESRIKERREQVEDLVEQAMAEDFPKVMNFGIQVSESLFFSSLECIPKCGTAESYGNSMFNFLRNCHCVPQCTI